MRQVQGDRVYANSAISIHAPHAGCDAAFQSPVKTFFRFQSTHPMRGATRLTARRQAGSLNFNPRTPCGVRLLQRDRMARDGNFNPRTPCGVRRELRSSAAAAMSYFNPRTPCGVRRRDFQLFVPIRYFNPRTPCGVRLTLSTTLGELLNISIHAPHAGCD